MNVWAVDGVGREDCLGSAQVTFFKACKQYCGLGLPDPDPSLFCTDPEPSISKQEKVRKTLISTIL